MSHSSPQVGVRIHGCTLFLVSHVSVMDPGIVEMYLEVQLNSKANAICADAFEPPKEPEVSLLTFAIPGWIA